MKYRTRTYYTDTQKALMWDRWKQGWTLHQIAHLFNRSHTSVQGILSRTGGFRPPLRSRCATALTLAEREEISRAVVNGQSIRSIERQTRYVMLVKVNGKDTQTVVDALIKNAHKLPQELYKSLTWDRGKEMAAHKRFTMATDIQVFFCDPKSPWQRGSNENTNGLLRQYMPKGLDISGYSQHQLNAIARQLNERPRKTLGFQTPAEMFSESVASTR